MHLAVQVYLQLLFHLQFNNHKWTCNYKFTCKLPNMQDFVFSILLNSNDEYL